MVDTGDVLLAATDLKGHDEATEPRRTLKKAEKIFLIDRIDTVTGGNLLFCAGGGGGGKGGRGEGGKFLKWSEAGTGIMPAQTATGNYSSLKMDTMTNLSEV
ncbi:hypothetical protein DID88_002544 [Monilinia fructigena]|uniref:Uncharacterized protein n=1 Tax=Monilinia fructigena TaxID=38457 RepID=A0A395IP46_9HELO|nr:hypothetical protein DID88_002544 [Monilinia fructigena]